MTRRLAGALHSRPHLAEHVVRLACNRAADAIRSNPFPRGAIIPAMKRLALLVTIVTGLPLASPALLASLALQENPVDVAGKWALTVETAGGTGTPSIELKQDGETLTGSYSSQVFGEQKVTGTIKGNAITFGFTTSFEGSTVTVTYSGTADASTMKGKVTVGDLGEGTFTGRKQ